MKTKKNNEQRSFGRYGDWRRAYLQMYRPERYQALIQSGTLEQHLAETEAAASKWIEENMGKTIRWDPCPKDADGMAKWFTEMPSVFRGAEEVVSWMYIYGD